MAVAAAPPHLFRPPRASTIAAPREPSPRASTTMEDCFPTTIAPHREHTTTNLCNASRTSGLFFLAHNHGGHHNNHPLHSRSAPAATRKSSSITAPPFSLHHLLHSAGHRDASTAASIHCLSTINHRVTPPRRRRRSQPPLPSAAQPRDEGGRGRNPNSRERVLCATCQRLIGQSNWSTGQSQQSTLVKTANMVK